MKGSVLWNIMLCSPLKVKGSIGGTCRLQGQRRSQARNLSDSGCYQLHAGFLIGLFFYPEDGGDMCLQNVDCQQATQHYIPEGRTLQSFVY
jgi:hypothetical protein